EPGIGYTQVAKSVSFLIICVNGAHFFATKRRTLCPLPSGCVSSGQNHLSLRMRSLWAKSFEGVDDCGSGLHHFPFLWPSQRPWPFCVPFHSYTESRNLIYCVKDQAV
uniref:Uncharacterized protein n=1 Tax=Aegilops tauschii subsp. strangulata TaxID=200361 RepID=A0A453DCB4_AEGTS